MKIVAIATLAFFLSLPVSAALVRRAPTDPAHAIEALSFPESDRLDPDNETSDGGNGHLDVKVFVTLAGQYAKAHWSLLWGTTLLAPDEKGNFELRVPVQGPSTQVTLVAVGPRGEVTEQMVELEFPSYNSYVRELKAVATLKPTHFNAGLSFTSISFTETNVASYSSISLTGRLTYAHALFSPNWDLSLTGYATLIAITKNVDSTARFLGLNLRAGYVVPQIQDPWRLSILGGAYYTTMFVSDSSFGFKNLAGPQLFPTVRRALRRGEAVSAYFKFSPISDGLTVLSLNNRELAGGLTYQRALSNGHPLTISVDLASLTLALSGVTISSSTLSLGAGYGF